MSPDRRFAACLVVAAALAAPAAAGWNAEADDTRYRVVINHEEQYSIWFADRQVPAGWKAVGRECDKAVCLKHIEEVWTDMRPLSWRRDPAWDDWERIDDGRRYKVVINHEEQYSVWFADRSPPKGWKDAGFSGSKKACLDRIEEVWTDMRPLSWRRHWER